MGRFFKRGPAALTSLTNKPRIKENINSIDIFFILYIHLIV
ncbi:hypothetical protein M085_3338 [Bacteroides fragilis str. 3986 N(B)19]|nr:hypothetical protein M085_3338 [Bacteroides fragilis str. 3986 N(B)19]